MLVRRKTLEHIGGLESIRYELIDDCALARRIKHAADGSLRPIWLGLSAESVSLRPYPALADVWRMVARTAFTELDHSVFKLSGAIFGMFLLYVAPPLLALSQLITGITLAGILGLGGWILMSIAFMPILKFYGQKGFLAPFLPLAGSLYTAMTFDSALKHWRGRGGGWKGRTYALEGEKRESQ